MPSCRSVVVSTGLAVVALLAASCGGGHLDLPMPPTFAVGGTVTGLPAGTTVTLSNGEDRVTVDADGPFQFVVRQPAGSAYRVGVADSPDARRCAVTGGRGTMPSADIAGVSVDCGQIVRWSPNGAVVATALSEDASTLYIAGSFNQVGPVTGPLALLQGPSGRPSNSFARFDGTVHAAISDGQGGQYVVGDFQQVDGQPAQRLVHVLDDGMLDDGFVPQPDGPVLAMALSGGTLFVGGDFTRIGGAARGRIAALDAKTGQARAWAAESDATVHHLVVDDTKLFVSGTFTRIASTDRAGLAALDADTGKAMPWNPRPERSNHAPGSVSAIVVAGDRVFLGGDFDRIGGAQRGNLAAVDTSAGAALDWNPRSSGPINAMVAAGDRLYVTGAFEFIADEFRGSLAAFDIRTGTITDWQPSVVDCFYYEGCYPAFGFALAATSDTIYVGGWFERGYPDLRPGGANVAAFSIANGDRVDWILAGAGGPVTTLVADGSKVIAGGSFEVIGGAYRSNIASIDTRTGFATDWAPDVDVFPDGFFDPSPPPPSVNALLRVGGTLYVAGTFDHVDGLNRFDLAAFDLASGNVTDWAPVVSTYPKRRHYGEPDVSAVWALHVFDRTLYFAGDFGYVNGSRRDIGLAAVDMDTGTLDPWHVQVSPGFGISTLQASRDLVFVGGAAAGAKPARPGLAAFDRATGKLSDWNPQLTGTGAPTVSALALAGSTLIVGGNFETVAAKPHRHLVAIDAGTGAAIVDWAPEGAPQPVLSLSWNTDRIYVGGPTMAGAVDAIDGRWLDWGGATDGPVRTFSADPQTVFIGGGFRTCVGQPQPALASVTK